MHETLDLEKQERPQCCNAELKDAVRCEAFDLWHEMRSLGTVLVQAGTAVLTCKESENYPFSSPTQAFGTITLISWICSPERVSKA